MHLYTSVASRSFKLLLPDQLKLLPMGLHFSNLLGLKILVTPLLSLKVDMPQLHSLLCYC